MQEPHEERGADNEQHREGMPADVDGEGLRQLELRAIQGPMRAPMNPRAVETMSPPRAPPAIALPMAPQTAAMTTRRMVHGDPWAPWSFP